MPETNSTLEERLRTLLARVPDTDANKGIREEINKMLYDRISTLPPDEPADQADITRVEEWETQFPASPTDRTEDRHFRPEPDPEPREERPTTARHHHTWLVLVFVLVAGLLTICLYFLSKETKAAKSAAQARTNTAVAKADAAQATADAAKIEIRDSTAAIRTSLDSLKSNLNSLRTTQENDMARVSQRLDVRESVDVFQGQTLAEFRNRLNGHDADIRQLRDFRDEANAWRDSILGRSPATQVSGKRASAPATPVVPKVETTDVVTTSTGPTVAVTLQNKLNAKARVAYESWTRVLTPNGQIVLNLPPGETIRLVVTNLRSGEGWVIPVDAANQRKVEIPPR